MSFVEGIGTLKLECPQMHPVGRILRDSAHQSVQFDPGAVVGPRRFWPNEDDQPRFTVSCRFCEKPVGEATSTLQSKFADIVNHMSDTVATATLPYV